MKVAHLESPIFRVYSLGFNGVLEYGDIVKLL